MKLDQKYIVMLIDKQGSQHWLSKWNGFQGLLSSSPKEAFTFHWSDTAKRAAAKVALQNQMTGYRVFEVKNGKLDVVR